MTTKYISKIVNVFEITALFEIQLNRLSSMCECTSLFGGLVIPLAHQSTVLHQVVLVTCGQLSFTHDTRETVQVIHEVLRPPDHLRGWDALLARGALCPESPLDKNRVTG